MERKLIDRINELAHKAKSVGLTEEEKAEREKLRNEYRAAFRASLVGTLEHTVIVNEEGEVIRRLSDHHKPE
ncbi:MAG: DUF896 domain-containing protein [Oscillospiraceae bacterium]|nr:DUF896 domain-containing protein [Oscillospiraceae bacterium]